MKIEKFEDLIAWQEARKLVNLIYDIMQKNTFKDFSLANQIQKAGVSVMANISEGFGRYTFAAHETLPFRARMKHEPL
jgi:four helix bundle protein